MTRVNLRFQSERSENAYPRTLTYGARLVVDLDWFRSKQLHRSALSVLCLAVVLVTFLLSFAAALRLKMHSEVPIWVVGAVPPALTRVAYEHDRNYVSLTFVHDSFFAQLQSYDAKHVNSVIANILAKYPVAADKSDRILPGDDKGIVVMTELAFRAFGYRVEGVLYLYYVILGLSAALFAYCYRTNPFALLTLAAFLLIHRMILPMIKYDPQLGAVTALRCMPVLAMIACMHCLLYLFESRVDVKRMATTVLQVAIMVFVVHVRSTTMWELMLVAACSLVVVLVGSGPVASQRSRARGVLARWPAAVPLAAVAVMVMVLSAHRTFGFPPEYHRDGETVTRPFWHNIYSGFAFNPVLAKRYDLKVDDFTVLLATRQFLLESGREDDWEAAGGNTPGYTGMRWKKYDEAVKDMLFAHCSEHFGECLLTFVYFKPMSMFKNLLWVPGLVKMPPDMDIFVSRFPEIGTVVKQQFTETTRQLDAHKERGRFWFRRMLLMVAGFLVLAAIWRRKDEFLPVLGATGLLAAGSTAPSIIGYAAPHTIAEAALAFPLFLVLLPAYVLVKLYPPRDAEKTVASTDHSIAI